MKTISNPFHPHQNNILSNSRSLKKTKKTHSTETIKRIWDTFNSSEAPFNNVCQPPFDCPMSSEEIAKHSILETLEIRDFPPKLQELMQADSMSEAVQRIAANFAGGGLITGGGNPPFKLDGMLGQPNFIVWEWLVSNLYESINEIDTEEKAILENILEGVSQLKEYCEDLDQIENALVGEQQLFDIALKYAEKVQQLQAGEAQRFFGGWLNIGGESGHALIYEFIRNENQTFDVFVYTSTGFQLADDIFAGDKRRVKPYVQFSQIPENHLCFNDDGTIRPAFFQHFIELNALQRWDNDFTLDEEDVLEALDHLIPYQTTVDLDESGAITGQRAGTCVPSSTKAWMRRMAGDAVKHKQIMFHTKFRLIVATYRALKKELSKDTQEGAVSRRLLNHLTRNHLRSIAKAMDSNLFDTRLIDDQLANEAQATCYHILKNLEFFEADIQQLRRSKSLGNQISNQSASQRGVRASERNEMRVSKMNSLKKSSEYEILPPSIWVENAREIPGFVETIRQFYEQCSGKNKMTLVSMQINQLVDQLPLPNAVQGLDNLQNIPWVEKVGNSFWENLSKEELTEILSSLEELLILYGKNHQNEQLTRFHTTLLSLHALAHYLAVKIDTLNLPDNTEIPRLEHYFISHMGELLERFDTLIYIDCREFNRTKEARVYFEEFKKHALHYPALFENEETIEVKKDSFDKSGQNRRYWEKLLDFYPELEEKASSIADSRNAGGSWKTLTPEEIEEIFQKETEEYNDRLSQCQDYIKYEKEYNEYKKQTKRYNRGEIDKRPTAPEKVPYVVPLDQPRRRVNLTLSNKCMLILEESIDDDPGMNPLIACGLPHIPLFRRITCRINKAFHSKNFSLRIKIASRRNSKYSYGGRVYKYQPLEFSDADRNGAFRKQHRLLPSKMQQEFFKIKTATRYVQNWQRSIAEGTTLKLNTELFENPLIGELLRSGSEWRLTPYQIIKTIKDYKEELLNPDLQAIIFRLILRSPITQNGTTHIGFGEVLIEDSSCYEYCSEFIQEGLNHFYSTRKQFKLHENEKEAEENPVNGARFFLELAFYTSKYLVDQGFKQEAQALLTTCLGAANRWLEFEDLTQKEKAVIHQYRLLFFSLIPIEETSPFEIYLSWISYQISPDDGFWRSPLLQSQIEQFVTLFTSQIAKTLQDDQELCEMIGSGLLASLQLETREQSILWSYSISNASSIVGETANRDIWTIDLISGAIFSPYGKIGYGLTHFPWENQQNFKRLFGDIASFSYQAIGNDNFSFSHPKMGLIRLVHSWGQYMIQRQFPGFEGVWFEQKNTLNTRGYPKILGFDHAYWIPSSEIPQTFLEQKITGLFSSLHGGKIKYATLEDGSIIEFPQSDQEEILHIDYYETADENRDAFDQEEILHIDLYETADENQDALSVFDMPKNILVHKRENDVVKISLPRYTSQEGNALTFYCRNQQMIWSENSQYVIPGEMPKGFLGTIPNYLYLESLKESNPDILLVPYQKILAKKLPAPSGKLNINTEKPLIEQSGKEQWGRHRYFIYHIVNGSVKPATLEGQLFLSYLSYSQKNYQEAVKWLKQIKPTDRLSPICENILRLIVSLPFGEDDPNARMVALFAEYLYLHKTEQLANTNPEPYSNKSDIKRLWNSMQNAEHCLSSLNNIDSRCRLTTEQELDLFIKLIENGERKKEEIAKILHVEQGRIENVIIKLNRRVERLQSNPPSALISKGLRVFPEPNEKGRKRTDFTNVINFNLPMNCEPSSLELYKKMYGEKGGRERYLKMQNNYESYQIHLKDHVAWIFQGKNSPLCTRPGSNVEIANNGTLLLEMHRIAKHGSAAERRAAVYRLWQWRIHSCVRKRQQMFADLMIHMLISPDLYKDPLELSTNPSDEEIKTYLEDLEKSYRKKNQAAVQQFLCLSNLRQRADSPSEKGNYPIPDRSSLDSFELAPAGNNNPRKPFHFTLPSNDERWIRLKNLKLQFLSKLDAGEEKDYDEFSLAYQESLLNPGEEEYRDTIASDLFSLRQDYLIGKKQNEENSIWTISSDGARELISQSDLLKTSLKSEIDQKTQTLLDLVNKPSDDPYFRQMEFARIGGGAARLATFSDCVEKVLEMDIEAFKELNSNLTNEEIQTIASLTIEIEDLKSYLAQIERIKSTAQKIDAIEDADDPTRCYQCQQLAHHLDAEYYFECFEDDLDIHAALRIFSGETEMIPHLKQINLIKKMLKMELEQPEKYRDIIIQLIMGGGKTSVIATIILYLAAKRNDRLSLFIIPPSLFATVEANISESVWKAFKKHIQSIDVNREDLTLYKLNRIIDKLNTAAEKHQPLIIKASTLQTLELELLFQGRQFKKFKEKFRKLTKKYYSSRQEIQELETWLNNHRSRQPNIEQLQKRNRLQQVKSLLDQVDTSRKKYKEFLQENKLKIMRLAEIWKRFSVQGDALIDEIDLMLDCLREVNFPDGEIIPIDETTNHLILACFKALVSDKLYLDNSRKTSINDVVRLQENKQTLLDSHRYLNQVVPVVAKHLFNTFEPIQKAVPKEFIDSFVRYLSDAIPGEFQKLADDGQMPNEQYLNKTIPNWNQLGITLDQAENDVAFLQFLDKLYKRDQKGQESANLIAVSKHLLTEILPATLMKSGRRNYGPAPKEKSLTIVPYIGVNSPATTLFGYFLEEACYYYQWIAAFPIQKQDILIFAESINSAARYYVEKNREKFEDTVEYQEFYRLFGITLDQVNQPEMLELAVQNISCDIEKKLDFQFEIVAEKVGFRSERLTSNGFDLLHQVSSKRTMSGTPWNAEGFDRKLYQRLKKDEGTEGKILHTLAKKSKQGQIYEVDFKTVEEFFEQVFDQSCNSYKLRGIIETGGLFKAFNNNADVAQKIMKCLAERQENGQVDPAIKGVLFFHKDPGQEHSDTLYIWKKGASHPERIGGTSKEALQAKDLDPTKYFVYYDERHTTGVDILQLPDAVNLLTFDEKMLRRTIGQGAMRLRQYLFSQNVEIVVTNATRKLIVNQGENLEDFLLTAEKNQSKRKTDHMVRYFKQQINGAARSLVVERIVDAALALDQKGAEEAFVEEIITSEPFFVTKTNTQFYLTLGKLKEKGETKTMLINLLRKKVNLFTCRINDHKAHEAISKEQKELKMHIDQASCLPAECILSSTPIGIQQEVEVEVEMETDKETLRESELEQELKLELEYYEKVSRYELLQEKKMSRKEFISLIDDVANQNETPLSLISLQNQLASFEYGLFENRIHYEHAFDEPIYGTYEFFHTVRNQILPVFHKLQRPASQILAVRTPEGNFHWLLLSEHEANAARKHLKELYAENSPHVDNVWLIQLDGSSFISGKDRESFPIYEESVERGMIEINAFSGNAHYLDQHPQELESWIEEETDLKIRFLKLRASRNEKENAVLRRNPIINLLNPNERPTAVQKILKKRMELEKNYKGRLRVGGVRVKFLSSEIRHLHVDEVPSLGIDWELRETDENTRKAFEILSLRGINNDALKEEAEKITKNQFHSLQPFQVPFVTKEQIKWLPNSKVRFLEHPEQICDISQEEWTYYLLKEQTSQLTDQQSHLIPFVNPLYYEDFTYAWQIAAIDPCRIQSIPPKLWEYLSKQQVKNLPLGTSAKELRKLKVPQKFGWIHGSLLESIPKEFLHKVCREQIQEIENPELIAKLEDIAKRFTGQPPIQEGLWTSWISPVMVEHINFDEQIQYLSTKQQIYNIPDEHVPKLNAETQVPLITKSSQVKSLEGEEQIQACPPNLTSELQGDQLNYISLEQIPFLRLPEQIQKITDPKRFACLTTEESFENKTINQMAFIGDHQLELISEEQVKGLSNRQILTLVDRYPEKWEELQGGLIKDQIRTFDQQELINLLSSEQIKDHLQKQQVLFLQEEFQIQACPDRLVRYLTPLQVEKIAQRQAQFLKEKPQIQAVKLQHIFEGLSAYQMKWIKNDQIKMVVPVQTPGLNRAQLLQKNRSAKNQWPQYQAHLSRDQIEKFDSQELVDLMSEKQISDCLQHNQIQFLQEPWQIQACPNLLVKHLNEEQVPRLESKEKISYLEDSQLPWIIAEQTGGLKIENLKKLKEMVGDENWNNYQAHLSRDQIEKFNTQELINLLNAEQITQYLLKSQVAFLQDQWQIQACPNRLAGCLNPEQQVPMISPSQVPFLKSEAQIQKCPCEKSWISKFKKQQFRFLTDDHISQLSDEQIAQMDDIENEIMRLATSQLHAVNPGIVQNFNNDLVERIQCSKETYPLIKKVSQNQVPLICNQEAAKHLSDEQIKNITNEQVNTFNPGHPLWGRINKDRIDALSIEKIKYLPKHQLKHLSNEEQIQNISFWKVKHLNREQLKSRSWGQFLTYTIGVITLGVASCIAALIAYASLVPLIILLANREKGRFVINRLNTNPHRLYRYFEVYLSKTAA